MRAAARQEYYAGLPPETGEVEIIRYAAVDDVGRAVNPLILLGQTHGGLPRARPGAAGEQLLRASERAIVAASFMDYAMSRADTLPILAPALSEVPTPTNRLGVGSGVARAAPRRHWLW
jgi:carbon-monoxide dehydrogenase large subunit